MSYRRFIITLLVAFAAIIGHAGTANASGGHYVFAGGTPYQQQQVVDALNASSFNWNLVPETVTITIAPLPTSEAAPGQIWLDPSLLNSGQFSWGVVQHEYAHEVDFALFTPAIHAQLETALGGTAWCYSDNQSLQHSQYGCERFASTIAWAFWQNPNNCMRPSLIDGESGGMTPAAFRALIVSILGVNAQNATVASHTNAPRAIATTTKSLIAHSVKAA